MVEPALFSWLQSEAGVTALIGSGDAIRAYPTAAEEDAAYPYVVYTVLVDTPDREIDGRGGINRANVQIDCYGGPGAAGKTSAKALALAIHGTKAVPKLDGLYQQTLGGMFIHNAFMERKHTMSEAPVDGSADATHRVSMDFVFWFDD